MAPGKKVAVLGCGPVGEQGAGMQFAFTCLSLPADTIPPTLPSPQPPTPNTTVPCSATGDGSNAEISHRLHEPHGD